MDTLWKINNSDEAKIFYQKNQRNTLHLLVQKLKKTKIKQKKVRHDLLKNAKKYIRANLGILVLQFVIHIRFLEMPVSMLLSEMVWVLFSAMY